MPKISIIVPVYKVEKYLSHCVESILAQTYTDWELLLIDDGSPDDSGKICDDYATQDSRIRVFHKENGGVSSARNMGIEQAEGDYIMFVDSDDWVDIYCLETCFKKGVDVDLYRFGMKSLYKEGGTPKNVISINEDLSLNAYCKLLVSRKTTLGVCGGMYKRSIFKQHGIRFDERLIMGEDWLVNFTYLKHCFSLCLIDKPLYTYNRFNESGCTNNFSIKKDRQMLEVAQIILNDDCLRGEEYNAAKSLCKVSVYFQTLSHAISLSDNFEQLKVLTNEINSLDIAPTLIETVKSGATLKMKTYIFFSHYLLLWYLLYLKNRG